MKTKAPSLGLNYHSHSIVQLYCELVTSLNTSIAEEKKIRSILELASYDKELRQWINLTDMLINYYLNRGVIVTFDVINSFLSIKSFNDFLINEIQINSNRKINICDFQELVKSIKFSQSFIEPCIEFSNEKFCRNLIFQTSLFSIYVIGWLPSQFSNIHHHGNELDAILVNEGQATHIVFYDDKKEISKNTYSNKDIVFVDRHQTHQIGNSSKQKLVTVHFRYGSAPQDNHWTTNEYTKSMRTFWNDIERKTKSKNNL